MHTRDAKQQFEEAASAGAGPRRAVALASAFVLCALIFTGDFFLPLGAVVGFLYVTAVFAALWSPRAVDVVTTASVGLALTVAGYVISFESEIEWFALVSRALALVAIGATGALGYTWRRMTIRLSQQNASLSREVAERTADLERVNAGLKQKAANAERYLNATQAMMVSLNREGRIVMLNEAACRTLGWRREELLGRDWFDICLPQHLRTGVRSVFHELIAGDEEIAKFYENPVLCRDGTEKVITWHNTILREDTGAITGVLSSGLDISARVSAEAALRASEAQHKKLLDEMALPCFIQARERVAFANPAAQEMLGLSCLDDLIGLPVWDLIPQSHHSIVKERIASARELNPGDRISYTDEKFLRADGSVIDAEITAIITEYDGAPAVQLMALDVTERRRAEEALRSSEEKYRSLMETLKYGVSEIDFDGRIVFANRALAQMYGYSREELTQMTITDLGADDESIVDKRRYLKTLREHQPEPEMFVTRNRTRDGRILDVQVDWTYRRDAEGNAVGMLSILTDVTERRRAEEALRESEERYRRLVHNIPDVTWTSRDDSVTTFVSANIELVCGFTASEILENGADAWLERIHPDDRGLVAEAFEALVQRGEPYDVEYRLQRKDNRWIWLHDRSVSTYERDGRRFADGLSSDITARKEAEWALLEAHGELESRVAERTAELVRSNDLLKLEINERRSAEQQLRVSEARYQALAQLSPVGIFRTDSSGKCVYVSDHWCEMTGLLREDALGYRWAQAIHPEDRARVMEEWYAATGDAKRFTTEFRLLRPDGAIRWILVHADPLEGPDGSCDGAIGAGADITERKLAEAELRRGKEALRVLLNANAEAAAMVDLDFRILAVSDSIADEFEQTPNQLLGQSILDFTQPDVRDARTAALREVLETRSPKTTLEERDGRTLEVRVLPIKDASGELERLALFTSDITHRRAAELETAESEQRLRTIVENMPVILDAFDENGNIVAWNAEAERITGYSADEIVGNPRAMELLYPDPEYREVMLNSWMSRGRNYRDWEWEVVCKDGSSRTIAWSDISEFMPIPGWHSWGVGVDVTDRRRSEQHLRESQRRLTEAQRVANIGFWDWDITNGNLYWSDEIYRIFGLSRQNFGATYDAFLNSVHPEDRGFVTSAVDAAVYDSKEYSVDHRIVLPSGEVRFVHEQGEVYRDERGVPVRMIGIVQDITESVRAREQLAETRDRLELALEGGDLGVWEWHPQTGRTLYDARWASILKYDLADVGTDESFWRSHVHPDDMAHALERWRSYLAGEGAAYQARYRMRAKSGEWVWILDRGKAVERDEAGRPLRVTGTHQDVTAQVQAETALRESEARFRELAEMLPEIVFEIDARGQLRYLNQCGYDLTGLTPADLEKGVNPSQFAAPEDRERVARNMARVMRGEAIGPNEYRALKKDGSEFPVIVRSAPHIVDGEVVGLRGLVIDLSDQKIREAEQTRAQKLESVGQLAGGIAHDFNNILTAVIGGLNLAKMGLESIPEIPDDVREDMDTAEKAAMQAQSLTQQLLTFARGGAPTLKTDTLPELITETAGFALRGSNVRQTIEFAEDLPAVEIDRGQISQVINNLVINAKQAMPGGGSITIRAENSRIHEGSSIALPSGAYVRIVVADEGAGIPPDILPKIFDPYFTTKRTGSGLGLATSYSIIKNHGGMMTVESELGAGATFQIYLPASERTPLRSGGSGRHGQERCGRVLVMDDEESIRMIAQRGLSKLGLDVALAASGEEAIAEFVRARTAGEPYNVLVMDLTVPGAMGGAEALQRIREIDPSVRAIVSSGYSSDPVMANYERYGFCDLVSKPFQLEELADAVRRALAESAVAADE